MTTVAGVDSSTQSCTLEVRDLDTGAVVRRDSSAHPPTTPPRSEQHPDDWWSALQPLLEAHGNDVAAISVAAQQHGMVVLGDRREVLRPAKLWNDTESAPETEALVDQLGPVEWAERCGSVPVPSMTVTKLAWLRRHEPQVHERTRHVLLPHDWITMQLCGALVTDRGDASGTGYWSPHTGEWEPTLLDLVGLGPEVCPEVLTPAGVAGRWRDAVVAAGTGDNMAAALGLGLRPGDVSISIGTSGVCCSVSAAPTADPSGAVAGFADATGNFMPLVCTLNAAKVTDAAARLLAVDHDGLDALALSAAPGAGGLVLVPYLDGERTPNRPDATGSLSGIRSDITREQLARASFEGVVCGLLDALDALAAAGVDATAGRLFLVGGGAGSGAYRRVLADLAQRPVTVVAEIEPVATGACVQAAAALTGEDFADVSERWGLPGRVPVVDPDPTVDAAEVRGAYRAASLRAVG
jgi:xylulokinase